VCGVRTQPSATTIAAAAHRLRVAFTALAAPGLTRVGARKERGGLTELNGAYQGREGLPKFAGASSYARPEIM